MVDRVKRFAKIKKHSACNKTIVHIIQVVYSSMSEGHLSLEVWAVVCSNCSGASRLFSLRKVQLVVNSLLNDLA